MLESRGAPATKSEMHQPGRAEGYQLCREEDPSHAVKSEELHTSRPQERQLFHHKAPGTA